MMNSFAKWLVVVQTALSLLFLTWAAMVYLQFNDFGWKEPFKVWETKDTGYRVPSMLDKSTAVLHELYWQNQRAIPGIQPAIDTLTATMEFFPKNHQFYVAELEKVRSSEEAIAPKKLTWKDGSLVLETKDSPLGKPLMKAPVEDITKSVKAITAERNKILGDIEKITPEIAKLIKEADEITVELYGTKDDKGNSVDIGLYEVLDVEQNLQDKIRQETEYITPLYVDAQRRADNFKDRKAGMERTRDRLQSKK